LGIHDYNMVQGLYLRATFTLVLRSRISGATIYTYFVLVKSY
jgi:hypothetical protein